MPNSVMSNQIHLESKQPWVVRWGVMSNDSDSVAKVSLLGRDDSTPVNIPSSLLMAVTSADIQFLLLSNGCHTCCSAPICVSIPSATRSSLELASQLLCVGKVEALARGQLEGVKNVMEMLAPEVKFKINIFKCKEEEEDLCLESMRWVNKGIKVNLSSDMDTTDDSRNLNEAAAEVRMGAADNTGNKEDHLFGEDTSVEAINYRKEGDRRNEATSVNDFNCGKRSQIEMKNKLQKERWTNVRRKVLFDQSVLDCGLIRAKFSAREEKELVPRKFKKESFDPNKTIECGVCSQQFTTASSSASHMLKHSDSRDDVQCPICAFSTEYSKLVNHIRSMHSREKVFTCELCAAEFSTMSAKSHHKLKHRRSDIYGECDNCLKFFNKSLRDSCKRCSRK